MSGYVDDFPGVSSKVAKLSENSEEATFVEEDRLSALPESLCFHILSFLGTKVAVRTAVLSRQWQFLWTDLSVFDIREGSHKIEIIRSFVDWVDKTLGICSGNYLNKFKVSFSYHDCFASSVDGWVQFLVKNKIKDVSLNFHTHITNDEFYKLPETMYYNSSMTNLSLRNCSIIAPPSGIIEWKSLTSLTLGRMDLGVMGTILSGCPFLEYLELLLNDCWGLTSLEFKNQSLKKLVLTNWSPYQPLKEVFAPYIQHLSISGLVLLRGPICWTVRLTDVSSLVTANLESLRSHRRLNHHGTVSDKSLNDTKLLLESLGQVVELKIGIWFCKVLYELKKKGWKLPQYSCKYLKLTVSAQPFETIPWILCLLESTPNIETLAIDWSPPCQKATAASSFDLSCDLLQLKTVKFDYSGRRPYHVDDPMPKLVELLLKSARILETMVIYVNDHKWSSFTCKPSNNLKLSEAVLSYPRSSPKAVVRLCY